jgi:hypothetical protein
MPSPSCPSCPIGDVHFAPATTLNLSRFKLLLQNLWHFRLANLAVLLGMAVATAVLTGALMVGDSVRGSLRDLAIQRLGPVDDALIATRFFRRIARGAGRGGRGR